MEPQTPKPGSPDPPRDPLWAHSFFAICIVFYVYLGLRDRQMLIVLASMLIFTILGFVMPLIVQCLWPRFYAKFYGSEGRVSAWRRDKWVNLAVSMVHSFVTSITVAIAISDSWREYIGSPDWIKPVHSPWPFIAMAISNGYCVYDTWDMLRIGMARQATFLMVHHGLLLACFYIALQHGYCIWFLTVSMASEANSVFLHLRVLLGMAGHTRSNSRTLRVVWWLLFITMYTTRLPILAYLLIRLLIGSDPWPSSSLWWIVLGILIGFNLLNFKLNRNVSKAYDKSRKSVISKRTAAIDALSSWVWPAISIVAGGALYFRKS